MGQHLGMLLEERVVEAREGQIYESPEVTG